MMPTEHLRHPIPGLPAPRTHLRPILTKQLDQCKLRRPIVAEIPRASNEAVSWVCAKWLVRAPTLHLEPRACLTKIMKASPQHDEEPGVTLIDVQPTRDKPSLANGQVIIPKGFGHRGCVHQMPEQRVRQGEPSFLTPDPKIHKCLMTHTAASPTRVEGLRTRAEHTGTTTTARRPWRTTSVIQPR